MAKNTHFRQHDFEKVEGFHNFFFLLADVLIFFFFLDEEVIRLAFLGISVLNQNICYLKTCYVWKD